MSVGGSCGATASSHGSSTSALTPWLSATSTYGSCSRSTRTQMTTPAYETPAPRPMSTPTISEPPMKATTITPMPTMPRASAARLRRSAFSPSRVTLARNIHSGAVYCSRIALPAVVRVMDQINRRFMEANDSTMGTSTQCQRR